MTDVLFSCEGTSFLVNSLSGRERVGEATSLDVEILSPELLDIDALLGRPATVKLVGSFGERTIHGIVFRASAIATSQAASARRYEIRVASAFHRLTLRRRTRIFQNQSTPDIVQEVLTAAGISEAWIERALAERHAPRELVVQYAETDAAFVRRLCEEDGIHFYFEERDGFDALVLADTSPSAPSAADPRLVLVDGDGLRAPEPAAFACSSVRRRKPGKVTLRDYDPLKPSLLLEGSAEGGKDVEKGIEVYHAPGRFADPAEGARRAALHLESLRAEARAFHFETSSVAVAPGRAVEIEIAADVAGAARPQGKHFIVEVVHAFRRAPAERSSRVTVIPIDVPYRLPRTTPRPVVAGVHSAIVTGAAGEEIHTDNHGRIRVHFPWDREQPADDKSSPPVRVMQANLAGPMLVPRVGWEVLVAFEDGDPDRPVILGRMPNAEYPPPVALPANKTMTVLSTPSSPGGGRRNEVSFDDAAGRQHMTWNAAFAKTTTVGNHMLTQTVGFESLDVKGNQSWTVGGKETVSVGSTMVLKAASQTATVGGSQTITIKATGKTGTGSESVLVGGALLEQVGNPVSGAAAFAESAALAGAGHIPVIGTALTRGYSVGKAMVEGYAHGGTSGALMALGQQAVDIAADYVPAGDALVAAADAAGLTPWSDKAQKARGAAEAGGGTGGPGGANASAAQAAPGHRKTIVDGVMTESIGGAYSVTTPGSIKWTTVGPSSFAIGGSHSTRAVRISRLTGGVSSDTAASIAIDAAQSIGRTVAGGMKTSVGGTLKSTAGGEHFIKAGGALAIKVAGSLGLEGSAIVFSVGSSVVAAHSGGILLKASKVTVDGKLVQSGKITNSE
ncbi:type VI secretion system Vgr family protein [Polyangium aurulentum]|uniref:type VI secretion system Vgr family protein n=1 Tax=Polyangium aurulentum TaxID=2567896 RepID=UPI00146A0B20|nr:type VI secretion system tip protein TssI/VgrG [Polyangium aurulentum]UQA63181.1 type VI secretion system tip protein VgrG [Polyangium aurulentum]